MWNDPEDWLIFENTHEAIVDEETWRLAQRTKRAKHRIDTTGEANPFTGLVFCADCGAKMYNHRQYKSGADPEDRKLMDSYNCSTYTLTIERAERKCFSHSISTNALRTLTLETIRTVSKYAIENEKEFTRKVREAAEIRQDEAAKDLKRKINKAKKRHEYHALEVRAEALDPDELETARLSLRPEEEKRAVSKVEDAYGESYDYATMREAKDRVSDLLGEEPIGSKPRSVRRDLQQAQEKVREHVQERRERLSGKEKENTWEQ